MATVAVIAAGEMGCLIGSRLNAGGARVLTSLRGRSAASIARAAAAGMTAVDDDDALVAQADFILSIVPPNEALGLAQRLQGPLTRSATKPVYIDCNTMAPRTAERVAAIIAVSGAPFIDGVIFGPEDKLRLYLSGPLAQASKPLESVGLRLRVMDGPVGAASAVKIAYSGITKGLGALGAAMVAGAIRNGSGEALREVLADGRPDLFRYIGGFSKRLSGASYRWLPEMEEIAEFMQGDPAAHDMCLAFSRIFGAIADTVENHPVEAKRQAEAFAAFFAPKTPT